MSYAAVGWAIFKFVAMMVVSYAINYALTPRNKGGNNAEAVSSDEWNFPQSDEGTPQAVFFGDCWTEDWQVLAYGNYRTEEIKRG